MRRFVFYPICLLFVIFLLPALVHLLLWAQKDGPKNWHSADWSSAGILERPKLDDARVIVFAARTGGLKGAFATHSWIVLKSPGATRYDRYDVVGWGKPVRKNAYDADGRWYSNEPKIQFEVSVQARPRSFPGSRMRSRGIVGAIMEITVCGLDPTRIPLWPALFGLFQVSTRKLHPAPWVGIIRKTAAGYGL